MLRGALPPSHMTFSPRSYVTNKIYISTSTIRKTPHWHSGELGCVTQQTKSHELLTMWSQDSSKTLYLRS